MDGSKTDKSDDAANEGGESAGSRFCPADRRGGQRHRQMGRPRRHALPAGAQRLSPHRPRQEHLPELRHRRRISAALATSATTTPTPPRKRKSTSSRSRRTSAGSASRRPRPSGPPTTSTRCTTTPRADQKGQGVRRRSKRRADPRIPRHADSAPGRPSPLPRPPVRGEPRPVRAHEQGRVPRRLEGAAREDRHGFAELQPARPGHVPHPARVAPQHRRQVVHLPDVRLGPRIRRLARADHALDLHAGVRKPPAALRLVHRRGEQGPAEGPKQIWHPQQIEFARLNLTLH